MIVAKPDWKGITVVCIASGPSLTAEDCETAYASGYPVIVTNTTFRLCPWADVLFAYDANWWAMYGEEVQSVFKGRLFSYARAARIDGVESLYTASWFHNFGNSGACAIGLSLAAGASKVVLLGFDCQNNGTAVHWHGDHPTEKKKGMTRSLTNAASMKNWPAQFQSVALDAKNKGIEVVNASRLTALKCFERQALELAL